jgi:hypothetical protein
MQRFGRENFGDSCEVVSGRMVLRTEFAEKNGGAKNSDLEGVFGKNLVGDVVFWW